MIQFEEFQRDDHSSSYIDLIILPERDNERSFGNGRAGEGGSTLETNGCDDKSGQI